MDLSAPPDLRVRAAPGRRPIRLYTPPATFAGKLHAWRYLILRRSVQFGVLLLFFGTLHWSWKVAGAPLLAGNLSASKLLGVIPMADPFAVLQQFLTGHLLAREVVIGAGVVLGAYALLGGRTFCAWVCPVNLVTDAAGWLRSRIRLPDMIRLPRDVRYGVLGLALLLSALTGVAAFEWVSPISMLHRELIYGAGWGLSAVLGVFLLDALIVRHGWCGHLCPLGAFYALVGRVAFLRVRFDDASCTHCGECARVCPEPQVLNLKRAAENGWVVSGECSNCARCIPICPEGSLDFGLRVPGSNHSGFLARRVK
jgi:ferredoxin-type protein NapH